MTGRSSEDLQAYIHLISGERLVPLRFQFPVRTVVTQEGSAGYPQHYRAQAASAVSVSILSAHYVLTAQITASMLRMTMRWSLATSFWLQREFLLVVG